MEMSTSSRKSPVEMQTSHAFASPYRKFSDSSSKSASLSSGCQGDPSKHWWRRHFYIKDIKNRSKIGLEGVSEGKAYTSSNKLKFWSSSDPKKQKKMIPKSTKFGPKIDPEAVLKATSNLNRFLDRIRIDFEAILAPKMVRNRSNPIVF